MKLSFTTQLEHIKAVQSDCLQATFDYLYTFINTPRGLRFIMRHIMKKKKGNSIYLS